MSGIHRIGQGAYYLSKGAALVTTSDRIDDASLVGRITSQSAPNLKEAVKFMSWGTGNDLPQRFERLISQNNVVPSLIQRKRDIMVGSGIMAYKKVKITEANGKSTTHNEEVEIPADAAAFFERIDIDNFLLTIAGELMKHSLAVTEFVKAVEGEKIGSIKCHETKYMRAEEKDLNGKIKNWLWSGHWDKKANSQSQKEARKIVPIPVYNADSSTIPGKFCLPVGDFFLNDGYYPIATWRGGKDWIELSNWIPEFHLSNLQHGYSIRWHVKIPADYFLDYEALSAATDEATQKSIRQNAKDAEKKFVDDINNYLAGLSNTGRAVFTKTEFEAATGKAYPGIEIVPLNFDLKDEALIKLFQASNTANVSGQGIHPSLANVDVAGKLFGSGTEVRNAFLLFLITNTPQVRRMMFKPIELVKKLNNWPKDIFYGIRDFELAPLSDSPSGMKPSDNQIGSQ